MVEIKQRIYCKIKTLWQPIHVLDLAASLGTYNLSELTKEPVLYK